MLSTSWCRARLITLLPLWVGVSVVGCAEKSDEEDDDLDEIFENSPGPGTTATTTDEPVCDGTWSVIEGLVTGPGTDRPAAGASVYAWADGWADAYETMTDAEGMYELVVEPTDALYVEAYTGEGCWSYTEDVLAGECQTQTVDIEIEDCDIADKPNLYLYPLADTLTHVKLDLDRRQKVVASIPQYTPRGWLGTAHTDGTWTENGRRIRDPFLFYEVSLTGGQARSLQRHTGWCLPFGGKAAVHAMADLLADYGFNARERDDFVDAWIHDLPPADSYAVYPQLDVGPYAGLQIRPALPVERLWLVVDDGAGCAPRHLPEVVPFDRRGAHGVEWGVIIGDLVR